MNPQELQQLFETVCQFREMPRAQVEQNIVLIARALLNKAFTPQFAGLHDLALRRAAYVIDFLSRLLVLDDSYRQHLRTALESIQRQLPPFVRPTPFYPNDQPGRDQIAQYWGLSNGMRPAHISGLLDLQRRNGLR